ncbi:MAG TPA: hypothetical protein VGE51_11860 [Fontimonas sp.]
MLLKSVLATVILLSLSPAARAGVRMAHERAQLPLEVSRPRFAALPTDPWDRPFVYRRSAESIVFYSTGPNGIDDDGRGDDFAPKTLDEYFRTRKIRYF